MGMIPVFELLVAVENSGPPEDSDTDAAHLVLHFSVPAQCAFAKRLHMPENIFEPLANGGHSAVPRSGVVWCVGGCRCLCNLFVGKQCEREKKNCPEYTSIYVASALESFLIVRERDKKERGFFTLEYCPWRGVDLHTSDRGNKLPCLGGRKFNRDFAKRLWM